ncbi:phosphoglucosamine mutase [Halomonas sp. BM-2019]|uniref:phosphoglucosamine mutase n=1 Tax=Halomonas sp. BM-2019 TaxID=2811227 RepID=UPI001B3C2CEE|nr:MAG: phosphoglucosamine mutase [Halomonas sp. BM-2019]
MTRRYFGTDGIRGTVGEPPITADFMLKLGWATGRVLIGMNGDRRHRVLIGKDTRISGYMFESALEAGLSAAGVDVALLGPMPTPAIAYLTRTFRADAGIVISASHNPFADNGIKFFSTEGAKLGDAVEARIEAMLEEPLTTVAPDRLGKVARIDDAAGRYIEFCKSTIPDRVSLRGLKVVLDCAHGATYHIAPSVFRELGAEVSLIGASPDGLNINREVGSTHPAALRAAVIQQGADLGVAFDGDGDRVRYVVERLATNGWQLGGESSGHIVCGHVQTTGDGIVSALQVLAIMVREGKPLQRLLDGMEKAPQALVNVRLTPGSDARAVMERAELRSAVTEVEAELGDEGRVLLRPSGTEPLIRVMVEGRPHLDVDGLARRLAGRVEALLG